MFVVHYVIQLHLSLFQDIYGQLSLTVAKPRVLVGVCQNGNGSANLWRLQDIAHVYTWGNKCEMLLLSHSESCTSALALKRWPPHSPKRWPPHNFKRKWMQFMCLSLVSYQRFSTFLSQIPSRASPNQFAHVICGHCRTTLMYPHGAPSVKCAVCQYVTNVNMANARVPLPANRPNGTAIPGTLPSTSMTQTVVVENPMSVDESGKLVSNVVVGVSTEKK
ncbi:hypothetical protein CUMW_008170 [Citrus unshiu]|nr:hypothetical protein CUMW_008170 [Citrus unshiu]GAY33824.1 hypothetical protein CUMW_008170 [Citrus unshiu]